MTVTRTRLDRCSTKGCPWPLDEDIHRPWCLSIPGVQHAPDAGHQHWPKRSQGGREIVAILCNWCHDRIDNGTSWGNAVAALPNGERWYQVWDLHGEILFEKQIGASSDGSEAGFARVLVSEPSPGASTGGDEDAASGGMREASTSTLPADATSEPSREGAGPPALSPNSERSTTPERGTVLPVSTSDMCDCAVTGCERIAKYEADGKWYCYTHRKASGKPPPSPNLADDAGDASDGGPLLGTGVEEVSVRTGLPPSVAKTVPSIAEQEESDALDSERRRTDISHAGRLGGSGRRVRAGASADLGGEGQDRATRQRTSSSGSVEGSRRLGPKLADDSLHAETLTTAPTIAESMKDNGLDLPDEFTFGDWTKLAMMVAGISKNKSWWAGDLILAGERFGERATQHWNDLGYKWESLSNCIRVCRRFPRPLRHGISFAHHAVVYALDPNAARIRLLEAEAKGWTVKRLREEVHGAKPKTARWALDELRERAEGFWYAAAKNNSKRYLRAFLDSLEAS